MADYPLLFFPNKERASRSKMQSGFGNYHKPSVQRQGVRITPKFSILNDLLTQKSLHLQQGINGIIPEEVLVLETIGNVEDFSNAVKKIQGLEWLGEIDVDEIEPDEDFYDNANPDKSLSGRLYLISTNSTAMNQLLSLWNQFIEDHGIKFQRGLAKFKDVFGMLKDIRKWDVQDRFEETKLLDIWRENITMFPDRVCRFEIELWYKGTSEKRAQSFSTVQQIITSYNGRIITSCDLPEINYHSVLAELPANKISDIINQTDTELVKCDNIMLFRPSGQIIMGHNNSPEDYTTFEPTDEELFLPTGLPRIAILDGYPLENHSILANRLIIDDPDGLNQYYQVEDRKHGTAMCSLIVKGDIESRCPYIPSPLYVRPIMRPNPDDINRREFVPNDTLLVDLIHRAVKRMYEGENNEAPVAPSVKIINLSIGDPDRCFYHTMSPLARLLDWLSYKYKVLFVVSAGNVYNEIHYNGNEAYFKALNRQEQEVLFTTNILNNRRNCRLLSPAETINNLTIGATHADNSSILGMDVRHNPYENIFPSTYTPIGGGYRKSIKPDFLFAGGRQMYDFHILHGTPLKPSNYKRAPGIKVAAPDHTLNKTIYEIGTSNSAALTSRNGLFCYHTIEQLLAHIQLDNAYIPLIIKTMLAHGCNWDNISENIDTYIDPSLDARGKKTLKGKWIGYGIPDMAKSLECTPHRATIIGFDKLKEEEAHVYKLPLPPSLSSQTINRRLTITLAWFTPVAMNNQRYRIARLWFESKNKIASKRMNADDKAVKRGTLQHEIFEGSSAEAFIDGDVISIKVNCSKDAKSYSDDIHYALMVSLEVAENIDLPIYQEIKDRIAIPIPINQSANI